MTEPNPAVSYFMMHCLASKLCQMDESYSDLDKF